MAKTLVLAEKPSVAREIARVLGCKRSGEGCLSGDRYIVTWALGHLVTLADPETYDDRYKTWRMETLPMLPDKMKLCVIPESAKQYRAVKNLLASAEVSDVVIATDAGREGELVARWILEKAGCKKPLKRLWISSQTDKAIREGFASLKDGKEYWNLYQSAVARAEADWLVGLNATRALTCKHNAQLSAGRVQTPTLAIILARETEIEQFRTKEYYHVRADLGRFFATYYDGKNQAAIYEKADAERIASSVQNGTFTVTDVRRTEKRTPPPALYDLTELQRDANKLYQYSPKQTLQIMQRLYENYKALTYPRTDSRYLTEDIVPTLGERLRAVAKGDFAPVVAEILKEKATIHKSCINNAKVSDHHAIIPTEQPADMVKMSLEEKRIYMLVVRRFLANFQADYRYCQVKADVECGGLHFSASGKEVVAEGWKKVYKTDYMEDEEETDEVEQTLPTLRKGDTFHGCKTQLKTLKTSPPSRYTEASLLSAMENPAKFISDTKMRAYIGGGLGTPATRADIIEKLFSSFYLEKKGNTILPTAKAKQLVQLVPTDLKEPLLTASWEKRLDAISKGEEKKDTFLREIRSYTESVVTEIKNSTEQYHHENLTRNVCPACGKYLLLVKGKRGDMLVCQDRECSYRQNLTKKTNVRCPNCHKTMEIIGEGEKQNYACICGYRERVSRFHENQSGGGASKAFTQNYLRKQQNEPADESPFAIALRKAQEKKK